MYLVDEQNVARLQMRQDRGQIAGLGDDRARGGAEVDAELARHDLRQRRFAQARRSEEQHVVQRLAAALGSLDIDLQVLALGPLADEVIQQLRPQAHIAGVLGRAVGIDQAGRAGAVGHRASSCRLPRIRACRSVSAPSVRTVVCTALNASGCR